MQHQKISEFYEKWIINYKSNQYADSIYFVWAIDNSDKKEDDKLLTDQSGKIITARTKYDLILKLKEFPNDLIDNKRTKEWILESLNPQPLYDVIYDVRGLDEKIKNNNLRKKDYESLINFINLYEDYEFQRRGGNGGTPRAEHLNIVWNYYYDRIFFPGFHAKNGTQLTPPKLTINSFELQQEFQTIKDRFEGGFD